MSEHQQFSVRNLFTLLGLVAVALLPVTYLGLAGVVFSASLFVAGVFCLRREFVLAVVGFVSTFFALSISVPLVTVLMR